MPKKNALETKAPQLKGKILDALRIFYEHYEKKYQSFSDFV